MVCFVGGCLWLHSAHAQNRDLLVANNTTSFNASIQRYSPTGQFLGDFALAAFASDPVALAFDQSGLLYVANQGNNTIRRYAPDGTDLGVFASSQLHQPSSLAFDRSGNLLVCNYGDMSLNKYSPSGDLLFHVATGVSEASAMTLDKDDNVYISSSYHYTVYRFAPDGTQKTAFAAAADLNPFGLAFDRNGLLYVANQDFNTVRRFSATGVDLGSFATTGLNYPFALAFDDLGDLYVSNQLGGGIRRFSSTGADLGYFAVVTTIPANPVGLAFMPVPEPSVGVLVMLAAASARRRRRIITSDLG